MTNPNEAVTIRPATALDAVNIAKLIKHALGADQGLLRVNDHKIVQYVFQTVETGFVAVADMSGRLMGSLALIPCRQPWSDDLFMSEAWFYVKPSAFTADTAGELFEAAERFGDARRVPLFFKAPREDSEKRVLLTSRHGVNILGTHYMRTPQGGSSDAKRPESALAAG